MRRAAALLTLVLVACAHVAPRVEEAVVSDRLFLGLSIPTGGTVSQQELDQFLQDEVVTRFPEGFTIWRSLGVYRGAQEETVIIELVHPYDVRIDDRIEAIARAYRARFHQISVLRVRMPARMEFIER